MPGFLSQSSKQVVPRGLLVILRLYLGVVFIYTSSYKLTAGDAYPQRMAGFLENALPDSHEFYRGFVERTVLPNKELFADLVRWGELLVGLSLVLGFCTRFAAAAGMFMNFNFLLAQGQSLISPSNNAAFIFAGLVVLLGAAGRSLGIDFYLAKKWPRVPLW